MASDDDTPPTGADIVAAARDNGDNLTYKLYGYGNETPAGQAKDHHFVADTLDKAGIGFGDDQAARPAIAHWADPDQDIPGWPVVRDGTIRPGDVLATAKPIPLSSYHGGGQQLGIATGNGTSVGVVDNDRVGESDFGHREGHDPVVRRYAQLDDEPPPPRAAPRPQVGAEDLPPSPDQGGCPTGGGKPCPWGRSPNGNLPNGMDPKKVDGGIVTSPPAGIDRRMPTRGDSDREPLNTPIIRR